jgi:hypothetical protein
MPDRELLKEALRDLKGIHTAGGCAATDRIDGTCAVCRARWAIAMFLSDGKVNDAWDRAHHCGRHAQVRGPGPEAFAEARRIAKERGWDV